MALTVNPVRPSVALDVDGTGSDGIRCSCSLRAFQMAEAASWTHDACDLCPDTPLSAVLIFLNTNTHPLTPSLSEPRPLRC
jgi:hypothetical protein